MSITEEWVICHHMWSVYEIGIRIQFSKQFRYVRNHLLLYFTNYYIFVHNYPFSTYYVPWSCKCKCLLKYIFSYCNIWPNQYKFHWPIFNSSFNAYSLHAQVVPGVVLCLLWPVLKICLWSTQAWNKCQCVCHAVPLLSSFNVNNTTYIKTKRKEISHKTD